MSFKKRSHGPLGLLLHGAFVVLVFGGSLMIFFFAIQVKFAMTGPVETIAALIAAGALACIVMKASHIGLGYIRAFSRLIRKKQHKQIPFRNI